MLDPKLAKLGFVPRKCRWGGRLFVKHCENQLHGIWVDLTWPTFRVKYLWHYDFIASIKGDKRTHRRDVDQPFDEPDFVVSNYAETEQRWCWDIRDDEAQVEASLHEGIELAFGCLERLTAHFDNPSDLLRLFPARVFLYRVYDIDGRDHRVKDVGCDLLPWLFPKIRLNPWQLMPFLQLMAQHFGDDALAQEYARAQQDLSRWFKLVRGTEHLPTKRILPVISPGDAAATAQSKGTAQ